MGVNDLKSEGSGDIWQVAPESSMNGSSSMRARGERWDVVLVRNPDSDVVVERACESQLRDTCASSVVATTARYSSSS